MDDLITATNDIKRAINLREDTGMLLAKDCFKLRKWVSNVKNVRDRVESFNWSTMQGLNAPELPEQGAFRMLQQPNHFPCLKDVDYGDPILIKRGTGRIRGIMKSYIAVFVCLATNAVHLELVTDLTTAAFLVALKRLMARRGKIANIHSDNATNFKGASYELHELYKFFHSQGNINKLVDNVANDEIRWLKCLQILPTFVGFGKPVLRL